ncbi:endonuclease MutS2 [Hymenobacter taeanensis]|uniref:Endonuclease MutS2 n=1 Tax=Hymenobacter taeanensis TaxID=2735321 RepID=A0A6M6BLU7_9BACT|nr:MULTISPECIES: Smr/MutS family protein [Hymenobacter]QJX48910.1 endonuclease MutS2 [Hymenobacter taeanensis]UOQ81575.1 Smr/MutS family protein [Hymenobacter sp. 5414T-23]
MILPNNFEQKIGFTQLREMLEGLCLSALGRQFVAKMSFQSKADQLQKLLLQTDEFRQLLSSGADFPSQHYHDVHPYLVRANIPGSYLDVSAFFAVKMSLRTIREALTFFTHAEETLYPTLRLLGIGVQVDRNLLAALDKVVDDEGQVRENASPLLSQIRQELINRQGQLRKQIAGILRHARQEGWVPEGAEPTIRGGRLVLPVIAEHKRRVKGLIHDESATGQTVFIEPEAVFELNNDIKDLENAFQRELIRILTQLTAQLRPHIPDLRKAYQYLGLLDFIRAKGRLAQQLEASLPELHPRPMIRWKQVRHPLLYLTFLGHSKDDPREVVPLDIELTPEQRILLISGPNAGGKSVSMKTVGLVQYMLQCGLLIPAGDGSEAGVFEDVFLDIGDEQSLENDLSTYSSHLLNMKQFVTLANKRSLILIDEFGTGTEPSLGGAIAEAVLEQLNRARAFGVITTHYTNLKNYAERTEGIVNGAMRYDPDQLQPLYRLEIGKPGSSFAIEIARKIGLPKQLVERATQLVGKDKIRYDRLLEGLEKEKTELEQRTAEAGKAEKRLKKAAQEYQDLKKYLDDTTLEVLRDAKAKAKMLLRDTNQQIEATIQEIRLGQAEKERTKEARGKLDTFVREKLQIEPPKARATRELADATSLKPGDKVALIGQEGHGEIMSVKGKTAEVSFGGMKTLVKIGQLEKLTRSEIREREKEAARRAPAQYSGFDTTGKMSSFSPTLDLRGERAEDALNKIMAYVDDAVMLGVPEIKILHGRGNGVLRQVVRDYLHRIRAVASVADEHADRGGDGATIAVLK